MRNSSMFVILLIALLLLFSNICFGFTPGKTDGPTITIEPGQSIANTISMAPEGATIILRSGTYNESEIAVNKTVSLIGEDEYRTVVDGSGVSGPIFQITHANVILMNMTVQNANPDTLFAPGVYVYNATNVALISLLVKSSLNGAQIRSSNATSVVYCSIIGNSGSAVYLHDNSNNNTLMGNTFDQNSFGVFIQSTCKNNLVFGNNFLNNTHQIQLFGSNNVFDNGYPAAGNFWIDATGGDLYSGQQQSQDGSDGVIDRPYPDTSSPIDHYPLKNILSHFPLNIKETNFVVQVSGNCSIAGLSINETQKSLGLDIIAHPNSSGVIRVRIPLSLISCNQTNEWVVQAIYLNATTISLLCAPSSDASNTYFFCTLSEDGLVRVEFIGTLFLDEFLLFQLLITSVFLVAIAICRSRLTMRNRPPTARPKPNQSVT